MVFENIPGSISVPDSIMPETLSVPDILLPQQYYDLLHKKHDLPEDLKLRLALLEDAISCFQNGIAKSGEEGMISAKKKELFEEAQRWIFSTMDEQDEPVFLLFSPVCESLNLNPNYIRKGLRAWEIKK